MAQKKFPSLHKIDSSMTWYSTIYNKNYKWLSNNYLFFLHLTCKVKFFINKFDFFWNDNEDIYNINFNKKNYKFLVTHFHKNEKIINLNTYLIDFETYIIILNVFLHNEFSFLKKKKEIKKKQVFNLFFDKDFLIENRNNKKHDIDDNDEDSFQRDYNIVNFNKNIDIKYIFIDENFFKNKFNNTESNNFIFWLLK